MNASVNWIAAYNYLFLAFNSENQALYVGGSTFCRMLQQVDPGSPSYQQLIALRQQQGKSTSRKDFYWDLIQNLPEEQRFRLYRVFVDHVEPHDKAAADNVRNIVFGGGQAVPVTVVPVDLWNSEKLNKSLKDIDQAIDAHHYNRATTLSYTCLEGLYKAYASQPFWAYLEGELKKVKDVTHIKSSEPVKVAGKVRSAGLANELAEKFLKSSQRVGTEAITKRNEQVEKLTSLLKPKVDAHESEES